MSHKLPGTASGDSSPKDVCQEQDRSVSTNEDRQHDSSCLYQQSGRDNIQRADSPDPEPMDVVPGEEHPHPSTIPTWGNESRSMKDRSDWKLDRSVFLTIDKIYGPMEVDLFASRLTNQCRRYFSWRPDPFAEATDAFLQDWTRLCQTTVELGTKGANESTISRGRSNSGSPSMPWYPLLLSLLLDWPRLLPKQDTAIESVPIMPQLVVWSISGKDSMNKVFQAKLRTSSSVHGEQRQTNHMTHYLGDGTAGVLNGTPIPFQDL